jgi:hypothetical protein
MLAAFDFSALKEGENKVSILAGDTVAANQNKKNICAQQNPQRRSASLPT